MKNIVIGFSEQKVQMSEKNNEDTQNVNELHAKTRGETQKMGSTVSSFLCYSLKDKRQAGTHSEASKPGERGIKKKEGKKGGYESKMP